MRYLYVFLVAYWLICGTACNGILKTKESVKDFIPGTYAKEVSNEFLIAHDTLIIQWVAGNDYLIVNRTAYRRIHNKKLLPQKFVQLALQGLYDEKRQKLDEQRLGKTFSFDPENKRLFEGASEYKKVIP